MHVIFLSVFLLLSRLFNSHLSIGQTIEDIGRRKERSWSSGQVQRSLAQLPSV